MSIETVFDPIDFHPSSRESTNYAHTVVIGVTFRITRRLRLTVLTIFRIDRTDLAITANAFAIVASFVCYTYCYITRIEFLSGQGDWRRRIEFDRRPQTAEGDDSVIIIVVVIVSIAFDV